jgi:hypothetical protein
MPHVTKRCFLVVAMIAISLVAYFPTSCRCDEPANPAELREIKSVDDLKQAAEKAGFDYPSLLENLEPYAAYGTPARARAAESGTREDAATAFRDAAGHRAEIGTKAYFLRDVPIQVVRPNGFDLDVRMTVGLRLSKPTGANADFGQSLKALSLCRADPTQFWNQIRNGKFEQLTFDEIRGAQRAGRELYAPDTFRTIVLMNFGPEKTGKLEKNPQDYVLDLVVDGLRYSPQTTWGYYRHDDLTEAHFDCDAVAMLGNTGVGHLGFIPEKLPADKIPKRTSARLLAASVRPSAGGAAIGTWVADKKYTKLLTTADPAVVEIRRKEEAAQKDDQVHRAMFVAVRKAQSRVRAEADEKLPLLKGKNVDIVEAIKRQAERDRFIHERVTEEKEGIAKTFKVSSKQLDQIIKAYAASHGE